jgi:NAD(P)-dependent dehydrogenase (short-subunit alcohol dehydrogenase family)
VKPQPSPCIDATHGEHFSSGSRGLVLVTGGTGVIGSEIVRQLCADSYSVAANYARNEQRAKALRGETACVLCHADISDEVQVQSMFAALPQVSAVVHAASVSRDALLATQSLESWSNTLRVNADGTFLVVREALRNLPEGGRVVVLASRVGEHGNSGQSAYAATKAMQLALVRSAAGEGGARRVCVNAICPGLVPSDMTSALKPSQLTELQKQSVLGTLSSARSVATLVSWLLSEAAAEVSGQVFHADSRI